MGVWIGEGLKARDVDRSFGWMRFWIDGVCISAVRAEVRVVLVTFGRQPYSLFYYRDSALVCIVARTVHPASLADV